MAHAYCFLKHAHAFVQVHMHAQTHAHAWLEHAYQTDEQISIEYTYVKYTKPGMTVIWEK